MKDLINTKNIWRKFNEDGSVRFFPGNTIISKVHEDSQIYPIIKRISEQFQSALGAEKYAFLPFESFHMTILQGVCDEDRKAELWSKYLPLDEPLAKVDDFFEEKFKTVQPLPKTEMIFNYIDISNDIILVRLLPNTKKDAQNLQIYRDGISEALGLKFPDHDSYGFHISVGYQLWKITENEMESITKTCKNLEEKFSDKPGFTLKQPEMTYFNNMFYFSSTRIERKGNQKKRAISESRSGYGSIQRTQ
jgi:hypothetical protein